MIEYEVLKKAEEKPKVIGLRTSYLFIGVGVLMLSVVVLFGGGISLFKLIFILILDILVYVAMYIISIDPIVLKKIKFKLSPMNIVIKWK